MHGMHGMEGMGDMHQGMGGMGGGMPQIQRQAQQMKPKSKGPPVIHKLLVSLEDLYSGTTKKMRITSKRAIDSHGTLQQVASVKEIVVKAGWKDGTKITFDGEGDDAPGMLPSDVIFVLETKPHIRFQREGDNLVYDCPIDLKDAVCGVRTSVLTLDNRQLRIDLHHATPDTVKIIPGEGMYNLKKQMKGDMRVKFKIQFPEMSDEKRTKMGALLT
eukprot:CAMPEP_0119051788 /NCGR_PEP_ID=MMETSP1177-20130426/73288_1 /TAXON_ID=2985 /ORGANISM="Ochromonas sp, Strain CCMP1899" /LENGTH=215 /DNA_ID=CAMNT_0007031111 /DNA_START=1 /DNA_END=648 /DNA_ORIENTATION=+